LSRPDLRPLLLVVSAPSGAGKTTLCDRLLARHDEIVYSVSCTTRLPRGNEVHGRDYFFLSDEEFADYLERGAFIEHAVVHDFHYGTLKATLRDAFERGKSVLMDIDVQGAAQIRRFVSDAPAGDPFKQAFVDIFVEPPSLDTLAERLRSRAEDSEEVIARRLKNAEREMAQRKLYRYRVVNADLDEACRELDRIVSSEQKPSTHPG